jgi:hypothetical protein
VDIVDEPQAADDDYDEDDDEDYMPGMVESDSSDDDSDDDDDGDEGADVGAVPANNRLDDEESDSGVPEESESGVTEPGVEDGRGDADAEPPVEAGVAVEPEEAEDTDSEIEKDTTAQMDAKYGTRRRGGMRKRKQPRPAAEIKEPQSAAHHTLNSLIGYELTMLYVGMSDMDEITLS